MHSRVFLKKEHRHRKGEGSVSREADTGASCTAKAVLQPPEAGGGMSQTDSLEPLRGVQPCQHLDLGPVKLVLDL